MKRIIGTAFLAASIAAGGAIAISPAAAAGPQSQQPVAQHEQAKPLTDVSAQRRHYRRHHRHYRHRHYRPNYYYGPRYYRPYSYRPYYYAPRPHFGFGFGFGPRYYW